MSRWYESARHLYDRVDDWLAKYGADANERLQPRRDGVTGEERFTQLVRQHVQPSDTAVDIGTGDAGWFISNVAPGAGRAVGFDYAARRLWHGAQQRATSGPSHVELLLADGRHIPIRDAVAGVITNRRGPLTHDDEFMGEGLRILIEGGTVLEITIGEQNACELDEAFGERSQMHAWYATGERRLDTMTALYRRFSLEVLIAESYVCREVFPSRGAFLFRLESTPTIDGFDPDRDAARVDRVIAQHGLALTVHRLVLVARKTA